MEKYSRHKRKENARFEAQKKYNFKNCTRSTEHFCSLHQIFSFLATNQNSLYMDITLIVIFN
jgi:hypothetical protein